ncbi:hypothetical protein [Acinetobacter sp.]|uniref:hypothetical protein n=1 Tax=Acinetobacter sp. TaxID=472 RepID=UPI00388D01A6
MPQSSIKNIEIAATVVDITAMEMQLINKKIPTLVLFNECYFKITHNSETCSISI